MAIPEAKAGSADPTRADETGGRDALILSNIDDAIIVTDLEGIVTYWNDGATRLFGWTAQEMIGRPNVDRFPEPMRSAAAEWTRRIAAGKAEFTGEWLDHRKDGSTVWIEVSTRPLLDASKTHVGVIGISREISQRKWDEARDRLQVALDEAIRPLTDPAEITAVHARLLGERLEADRCAYADVEADQDTFNLTGDYNRGVPSIVGRYRFSDFGAEVLHLMRADKPYAVEDVDTHEPPIGDLSYYRQTMIRSVICVPMHKAGRFVAAMAVHQKTPRRWLQQEIDLVRHVANRCWESIERTRVERELRESESAFRQLADAMPQIVWAAGPDGVLDYYNRRWFEYIRLPESDAADAEWSRYIHPDDLPATYRRWAESLRSGEPYTIEFRVRGGDGQYRWFLTRALQIRDASGTIIRWFGTCTDIGDMKSLQERNQHLLESERAARTEAERTSRIKDEFLATLSHELRTPLNAILGYSQLLRSGRNDPGEIVEAVEVIERNARAQTQIIEDLLDMSRIISGKFQMDVRRIDLPAVLAAAIGTVRPAADAKGVVFQAAPAWSLPPVNGDANRLQQVFWNLLTNAIKFTPRGGEVRVVVDHVDSVLQVAVSDTGEGITPEFLPHVFDRFMQADASTTRRHGGLGLGLSIVRQLVELHGGTVHVKSAGRGQGATFIVELPIAAAANAAIQSSGGERSVKLKTWKRSLCDTPVLQGLRVLVVDDERDARELIRRLLENCEAEVVTAGSALEALDVLAGQRFGLILSDIGMPQQDGYELIAEVRRREATSQHHTPAIALTAFARSEDRTRALLSGYQNHISKPVEPTELIAAIASLTNRGVHQ